jgi:hypothetical protein
VNSDMPYEEDEQFYLKIMSVEGARPDVSSHDSSEVDTWIQDILAHVKVRGDILGNDMELLNKSITITKADGMTVTWMRMP